MNSNLLIPWSELKDVLSSVHFEQNLSSSVDRFLADSAATVWWNSVNLFDNNHPSFTTGMINIWSHRKDVSELGHLKESGSSVLRCCCIPWLFYSVLRSLTSSQWSISLDEANWWNCRNDVHDESVICRWLVQFDRRWKFIMHGFLPGQYCSLTRPVQ